MMYNHQLEHGIHLAALKCDSCGAELYMPRAKLDQLAPDEEPLLLHSFALRAVAQNSGWAYVLVSCKQDSPQDLCPACFVMPPEG